MFSSYIKPLHAVKPKTRLLLISSSIIIAILEVTITGVLSLIAYYLTNPNTSELNGLVISIPLLGLAFGILTIINLIFNFILFKNLADSYNDLINHYVNQVVKLPIDTINNSELIEIFRNDVQKYVDQIVINLLILGSKIAVVLFTFIAVYFYSISIGISISVVILTIFVIIELLIKRRIIKNGKNNIFNLRLLTDHLIELDNLKAEAKLYRREGFFIERIISSSKRFGSGHFQNLYLSVLPRALSEIIIITFLISLSVYSYQNNGAFEMILILIILFRILPLFLQINSSLSLIRGSSDSVNSLKSIESLAKNKSASSYNYSKILSLQIQFFRKNYSHHSIILNQALYFRKDNIYLIKGASGKGKSTILKGISGLIPVDEMLITINESINVENLEGRVAYVPQRPSTIKGSFNENITLDKNEKLNDTIENLIEKLNLSTLASTKYQNDIQLQNSSGGQMQRIAIVRSIFFDKEIILLDEPTSALDEKNREELISTLTLLKKGRIIIIVTHDNQLDIVSDKIYNL